MKNMLATEKTMTIGEIADAYGVSPEAIKKHVRFLYPDTMRNGVMTFLTEEQVTRIKERMIPTTQVVAATTELEMVEKTVEVIKWLNRKYAESQERIKELTPKAAFFDQVTNSKDAIDIGSAANVLNLRGLGRNNLFAKLRNLGILKEDNQPYREYIDRGYFRTIEQKYTKPDGSTHINIKTVVYQKGLDYIRKAVSA